MSPLASQLADECRRHEEDARYTAATFYIWLRTLRFARGSMWLLGALCAVTAASTAIKANPSLSWLVAFTSLGAVAFPAMVKALKLDEAVTAYADAAARMSNLRAAVRQAADIWVLEEENSFKKRVEVVFAGVAAVRSLALTPPEWCFWLARRKIDAGHYRHEPDSRKQHESESPGSPTPSA